MDIMQILEQLLVLSAGAGQVSIVANIIAAMTPSRVDNALIRIVDVFAFNWGRAKNHAPPEA